MVLQVDLLFHFVGPCHYFYFSRNVQTASAARSASYVHSSWVPGVLVGKPEGRRPLGRPRRRWVDNIRTDLQEVGCGYMDWIGLAQDRDSWRTLVSAVMNLGVP